MSVEILGSAKAPEIPVGRAQRGLIAFDANNVNPTWTGFVTVGGESVHCLVKALSMRQLLNELVCALIGYAVNLPVPQCYIVVVDDERMENRSPIRDKSGAGIYFGSQLIGLNSAIVEYKQLAGSDAGRKIVEWLLRTGKLGEIYSFDEHCANTDRHFGNILLSPSSEVWLIDHGHALSGPNWLKEDLDPQLSYESRLEGWCTPCLTPTEKVETSREVVPYVSKAHSVNFGVIVQYLFEFGLIESDDRDALELFVRERIRFLPPLVSRSLHCPMVVS